MPAISGMQRLDKQLREELNSKETKKYPEINGAYAHLKSQEETPWLYDCPSVILRNSISNWRATYQDFFKKRCGPPQHKKKGTVAKRKSGIKNRRKIP